MGWGSVRKTIRHTCPASRIRNSWQRTPIDGIGREWGIGGISPSCKFGSSTPASMRASGENGGVLISPLSHTNGRDCVATAHAYIRSDIAARGLERSRFPEPRDVGLKGTKVGRLPASCEQGAAGRDREDGVNSV